MAIFKPMIDVRDRAIPNVKKNFPPQFNYINQIGASRLKVSKSDFAAITCFAAITYLSLTSLPEPQIYPGSDKLHHFIAYAVLAFFATLSRVRFMNVVFVGLLVIAYGGFIEIVQPHVNRFGDWQDFWANTLGAVSGMAAVLIIHRNK